ncbi:Biopolymer transport protein [Parvularcula bermudensis HTCC2503]|uniref:Biopolymer transport protein n=1 Tax=Parvularcula bermudensis (strain ATCC BAA-594 / HTCC2503 / KCTC 12087) TaxID=314260 RepID=E0TI21_PARBH|nr:biopolymer transporter ExbD [Parvularcula bermudensis]ADM09360.1 Biopolymer transport protein [Parvularcula bermudensis HTCC2503]
MARRVSRTATAQQDDDVNVTPLLDIVFIMLIFFIVTSTFIKEPGIDPTRPLVVTQEEQNPAILVAISENDEIFVNNEQVELSELGFHVRELRKETPKGGAVLQADTNSRSRTMLDVLREIEDAGVDDIAVSTELL